MGRIGKTQNEQDSAQAPRGGVGTVSRGQFRFRKEEHIRHRRDFQLALRYGSRRHTKHYTVILRPNDFDCCRLGLTVSKSVGNAVKRNRVKRHLREFFRLHKHKLPRPYDLVIVAKKGAAMLAYPDVREELAPVLFETNAV
jgi:ribonuclease P protein component